MAILIAVLGCVAWPDRAARRLDGNLALQFRSSSPQAISARLQGRLPVHLNLPLNAELPPQEQQY